MANDGETGLTIREAVPGDEEVVARLIALLAEYERAPEKCVATAEKVAEQLFGPRPAAHAFLAEMDGQVVGFALYFHSFSTWLCRPGIFLEDLFVVPEYRCRGIGGALLRRVARVCVEEGCGRLEWTCLEWNELAKSQYRKIGAEPMEGWRTWRMEGQTIEDLAAGRKVAKEGPGAVEAVLAKPAAAPDARVAIYTDGGCVPNPGTGGWAAVLISGDRRKEIAGGEKKTTNNRMELTAAIMALEHLRKACMVDLHTDSEYLKRGITEWLPKWKRAGWRRGKSELKNVELWKRLDDATRRHKINWRWLRGHAGHKENERADELCRQQIDKLRKGH